MGLGDLILQNLFGIIATVIAGLILGFARSIRASTRRTEAHAEETAAKVSALDQLSTGSYQSGLDAWKREILLRVDGFADGKSDTLAWQAQFDRRLAALERFAQQLDDFAHGRAEVPTFTTTTIPVLQEETA